MCVLQVTVSLLGNSNTYLSLSLRRCDTVDCFDNISLFPGVNYWKMLLILLFLFYSLFPANTSRNLCSFFLKDFHQLMFSSDVFSFQRLRRLSTKYRTEKIYPTNVGEREENVKKNRYKDILPCKSDTTSSADVNTALKPKHTLSHVVELPRSFRSIFSLLWSDTGSYRKFLFGKFSLTGLLCSVGLLHSSQRPYLFTEPSAVGL